MAETDLLSSLLSSVFQGVVGGGQTALTKLLLDQIDPGRAARFEVLPPTQAGAAQTALFSRLAAAEPAFAALRDKPPATTPEDVVGTALAGITPGLTRTFQQITLPNLQAAFSQAGAGSSGRLAGESERLFRTNVSEPAAEAAARSFEQARQFNESNLLQRFLTSLAPQQAAASIRPEDRDILAFPAEQSLFEQTALQRLLGSLGAGSVGGAGTAGGNALANALVALTSGGLTKLGEALLPQLFPGAIGSSAGKLLEELTKEGSDAIDFDELDLPHDLDSDSVDAASLLQGGEGAEGLGVPTAPGAVLSALRAAAAAAPATSAAAPFGLTSAAGVTPELAAIAAGVDVPAVAGSATIAAAPTAGLFEAAASAFSAIAPTLPFLALAAPTLIRAFTGNPASAFEMGGGNVTREADEIAKVRGFTPWNGSGNPWVFQRQDGSLVWDTTPEAKEVQSLIEKGVWRTEPWAVAGLERLRREEAQWRASAS